MTSYSRELTVTAVNVPLFTLTFKITEFGIGAIQKKTFEEKNLCLIIEIKIS
jgi:hypothetical protein